MPNIADIIMHKKAILLQTDKKKQTADKLCNCKDPSTGHLERRCKEGSIMYTATFTLQNKSMVYYGAVKRNSKVNTVTTSKASSLKIKSTPQNSRKQSGMSKMREKLH